MQPAQTADSSRTSWVSVTSTIHLQTLDDVHALHDTESRGTAAFRSGSIQTSPDHEMQLNTTLFGSQTGLYKVLITWSIGAVMTARHRLADGGR